MQELVEQNRNEMMKLDSNFLMTSSRNIDKAVDN
jgi:hypothetical protein